MRRNIILTILGFLLTVISCSVLISMFLVGRSISGDTRQAEKQTNEAVADIVDENARFKQEVESITKNTQSKVVTIRDDTRKEIAALPPDAVADAIRYELEMFRGRDAGNKDPAYPGGLDGD